MPPKSDNIYASKIEQFHFEPDLYDLYWRFIAERQTMWVRRAYDLSPRPWTTDSILSTEFITNMYRELDPGTQYVITQILNKKAIEDRVFHVMLYRLSGSQSDTHWLITKLTHKTFTAVKYVEALSEVDKGKVFGDAYRVAGYETEGGATKVENVGLLFERLAKQMGNIIADLANCVNTREAYDVIHALPGFGDFLAHQITVDLLYDNRVLTFGDNQWAAAGPGARNGMWAMLKPNVKPRNLLMVMEFLRDHQQAEFEARGIAFPYLADNDGNPVILSLCNIQSTLCEFFKYVRLWDGSTQKVRRYIPNSNATSIERFPVFNSDAMLERWREQEQLTPPPPVGGRKLPEQANQPEPDIDANEPQRAAEPPQETTPPASRGHAVATLEVLPEPVQELSESSFTVPAGTTINIHIHVGGSAS